MEEDEHREATPGAERDVTLMASLLVLIIHVITRPNFHVNSLGR